VSTNIRLKCLALICALPFAGCPVAPIPSTPSTPSKTPEGDAQAAEPGWDGEYRGAKMTVVVELQDDALSGSIALNGKAFTLTAAPPKAGESKGTFESDGTKFDVVLKRTGDQLELETGGTTYTLKRWTPPNPLAKPNPLASADPVAADAPATGLPRVAGLPRGAPPRADSPQADPPQADPPRDPSGTVNDFNWTVYKHREGLSFRHPPSWTVELPKTGLFLVPGDLARNEKSQPLELFIADADMADGVTDPASPRAAQLITKEVQSDFPFLSPMGQPETVTCRGGPGAIHTYAGTNPIGKPTLAKVHVMIVGEIAVTLYAIGQTDIVEKRMPTAKKIFENYEFKRRPRPATPPPTQTPAGNLDPNLIGYWRHTKTYFSGGFSMSTDLHLVLSDDGTCAWNSNSAGGMGGVSVRSSGSGWEYTGTWSVTGKTLNFKWTSHGNTTESHDYFIEGNSMLYQDSKPKLWKLIRR
jgi:hypothetical protein